MSKQDSVFIKNCTSIMTKELELKILGSIGEINESQGKISTKVEAQKFSNSEYELYISNLETNRILVCKFILNEEFFAHEESFTDEDRAEAQSPFRINLWKTIHVPFCICDFALSNDGLWIVGEECYSNIKPYIADAVKVDTHKAGSSVEDHFMDVDNDDFNLREYEFTVELPTVLKHNIASEKFCLKCDYFEKSIIIGSKNMDRKIWQFDLITSKYESLLETELSDITQLPSINLTHKETSCEALLKPIGKPVFILYPANELEKAAASGSNVLHMLLSTKDSDLSNCVSIVGHPEGNVFYFLSPQPDEANYYLKNIQAKELYDLKQPVVGIHTVKDIGGIKGIGLLLIGIFGKVVYISGKLVAAKQKSTEIVLSESVTLYATTFELPLCVKKSVMFRENIFYMSPEGKVCLSEFSKKRTDEKEYLVLFKNSFLMQRVADFVLLNESTGLCLLVTNSGCLHLSQFMEKEETTETSMSLPSLMNEAIQLSKELQKLSVIKSFQTMFFKAVSTFATIKFRRISDMSIKCTYSISEIKNPCRKFLLIVDIQGLDEFEMKSEYWYITASVYSCFQKKSPVITKTVPFNSENTNISIEVEESLLSSAHSSSLPIMLELGLILTLPEEFKTLDCFKLIKEELPLYVKVKELFINELCLMTIEPNTHKKIRTSYYLPRNGENLLEDVITLCKSRKYVKLLKSGYKIPDLLTSASFPSSLQFCMLQSTADSILKLNFTDAVLSFRIFQTILQKTLSEKNTASLNVKCRDKIASIQVSPINNSVNFAVESDAFDLLSRIRMAITSTLIMLQCATAEVDSRSFSMSAKLSRDCEELSKELLAMYGQDVDTEDFIQKVLTKYEALRKISSRLIFC